MKKKKKNGIKLYAGLIFITVLIILIQFVNAITNIKSPNNGDVNLSINYSYNINDTDVRLNNLYVHNISLNSSITGNNEGDCIRFYNSYSANFYDNICRYSSSTIETQTHGLYINDSSSINLIADWIRILGNLYFIDNQIISFGNGAFGVPDIKFYYNSSEHNLSIEKYSPITPTTHLKTEFSIYSSGNICDSVGCIGESIYSYNMTNFNNTYRNTLKNDIVEYFSFDGNLNNKANSTMNISSTGDFTYIGGKVGLAFNGTLGTYINASRNLNNYSAWTFAIWFKQTPDISGLQGQRLISNTATWGGVGLGFQLQYSTDAQPQTIRFCWGDNTHLTCNTVVHSITLDTDNTDWNLFIGQYDGEKIKWFLNNQYIGNGLDIWPYAPDTNNCFRFGKECDESSPVYSREMQLTIDEFIYFNKSLSYDEMLYLWNNGDGVSFNEDVNGQLLSYIGELTVTKNLSVYGNVSSRGRICDSVGCIGSGGGGFNNGSDITVNSGTFNNISVVDINITGKIMPFINHFCFDRTTLSATGYLGFAAQAFSNISGYQPLCNGSITQFWMGFGAATSSAMVRGLQLLKDNTQIEVLSLTTNANNFWSVSEEYQRNTYRFNKSSRFIMNFTVGLGAGDCNNILGCFRYVCDG